MLVVEALQNIFSEMRVGALQIIKSRLTHWDSRLFWTRNTLCWNMISLSEGNSLLDQEIRETRDLALIRSCWKFGGMDFECERIQSCLHRFWIDCKRTENTGSDLNAIGDWFDMTKHLENRIISCFFIDKESFTKKKFCVWRAIGIKFIYRLNNFMKIPVVGWRNSFSSYLKTTHLTQSMTRISKKRFQAVMVLLLWHQGTTSGIGICKLHKFKLAGWIDDEILGPSISIML